MKKKIVAAIFILCTSLLLFGTVSAADASDEIVILYTNDVHCSVDENIGYAGLAAYKTVMEAVYGEDDVTLVDAGDAVQGSAIGSLSTGEYIVDIINKVGYDVVTLGNHEFDYGMDRLLELMEMEDADVVSCNFKSLQTGDPVFKPYKIIDYGDTQIAFVGITTPKSFTSSTPKYFQNSQGNYIYSFCEDTAGNKLYATVQNAVNAALAEGADCIVAVGHCGIGDTYDPWESIDIIANTTGIDVFIDGHSHSTIKSKTYLNKDGKDVILSSTGTKLATIGKLIFSSNGTITTDLVTGYADKDENIKAYINDIKAKNEKLLNTVVAKTEVALIINNPVTGERLIRKSETNLGDLVTDAYRNLLGADIAVVNGGGIRADIAAGDITYNDIISVHPFGNSACLVEATGQEIMDLLEMGARNTPGESGGFQQVSGLTYEIHTYIKPSVVLDDKGNFVKVGGEYRVHNVMVGGKPLDLNKTYTVASHNYLIKNGGDGFGLFMDNNLLKDEVMIDNQVLISYIIDNLGGVVGDEYKYMNGQGRIAIFEVPPTVPGTPTGVSAATGQQSATVSFIAPNNGGSAITNYIVTSSPGGITANGIASPIVITGLNAGTAYTFKVKAVNAIGIGAESVTSNTVTPTSASSSGGGAGSSSNNFSNGMSGNIEVDIQVNGQSQNIGIVATSKKDDQTVTTVKLDQQKLDAKLAQEGNNVVVTIPVTNKSDVVVGQLTGQMVKNLENKQAVVEIKTECAAYTLPAQQIKIDAISEQLGSQVDLKDIKVQIEVARPTAEEVTVIENSAKAGAFTIVAPPVEFTVTCTYDNKTVSVMSFNNYVERTIAIPAGVDPSKITTGVEVEPDGTVRHVPTELVQIDGKYYAKINSLTNSTYTVVWHPLRFKDLDNHWAKEAINDLGSRMVISGVGDGNFAPDRDITRAEFAAIIVKALGLKPVKGVNPFRDVKATEWYCSYTATASKHNIISGYGNDKFGPEDRITREQAMSMIARAMKVSDLKAEISQSEIPSLMTSFGINGVPSAWAQNSIALCVKTGIADKNNGNITAVKGNTSRAETAVMIRNFLKKSGLI